jgi:hypothetical protein
MMLFLTTVTWAASPSVGVAVSGEAVLGKALNDRFNATSPGLQLQASAPVFGVFDGQLTFGYRRLGGTQMDEYLWYSPLDLTVGVSLPVGEGAFFAHAGPSLVIWGTTPNDSASSGGNWGAVAEVGARFPTRIYQPAMHDTTPALKGLDVVVSGGGRWSDVHDAALGHPECGGDCGLDFSAIRLNAGLAARF